MGFHPSHFQYMVDVKPVYQTWNSFAWCHLFLSPFGEMMILMMCQRQCRSFMLSLYCLGN